MLGEKGGELFTTTQLPRDVGRLYELERNCGLLLVEGFGTCGMPLQWCTTELGAFKMPSKYLWNRDPAMPNGGWVAYSGLAPRRFEEISAAVLRAAAMCTE